MDTIPLSRELGATEDGLSIGIFRLGSMEEQAVQDYDTTRLRDRFRQPAVAQSPNQERQRAEEAVRQARAYLSQLMTSLDELAGALDRTDRQADANDSAADLADAAGAGKESPPPYRPEDMLWNNVERSSDRARAFLFQLLADSSRNWEYWVAPDGRLEYISPACAAISGYAAEEFLHDPGLLERIVVPEDQAVVRSHCQVDVSAGDTASLEFRIRTKSGDLRWISHSCQPVFVDQRYLGTRATNQDITERNQLRITLANAETFTRTLLNASTDEIEVVDAEGTIIYLNETITRRLGQDSADLIGRRLWDVYPPGKGSHRKILLKRVVETGTPLQFVDQQGEQWNEVAIYPLYGENGRVAHVVIATRDVTRHIRTEERLKLVTLQLLTVQEDERRRIAQDLHDDIGQNMTTLILSLKAIDRGIAAGRNDVGNQVKEALHTVETMMKHVRQVYYELRPPSLATVSLANVLEALCASFALSTGLRVDVSSQEALPPIPEVQATALYRLVQEGLHNAVKHARATSVWVNLEYVEGEISVSVEDDGQGWDPAQAVGQGMGLQGIRDRFLMLNGSFDIEAAPGKGTRLYGSLLLTRQA